MEKPDSDYDFIGIASGQYFYAYRLLEAEIPAEHSPTGQSLSVSINLQHETYFKETLDDAFINSVMLVYLPPEFVFLEQIDIRSSYILYLPNLRQCIQMDSTHNAAKAKRLWRECDFYTAKKNVLHGIRYLKYALQLLENGTITDFKAGNEYFNDIMNWEEPQGDNFDDKKFRLWRGIHNKYSPLYTELTTKIRDFCQARVDVAVDWERKWIARRFNISEKAASNYSPLGLVPYDILTDYLTEFGWKSASEDFGIKFSAHLEHPDVFTLRRTQMAQLNLATVQWSSGIIIKDISSDKSRTKWTVVAAPFLKMFSNTSTLVNLTSIEWSKPGAFSVEEHLDGVMAMLYYYGGKWNVASGRTPDGSELLGWVCPIRQENWDTLVEEGFNFNPVHEANMLVELSPGKPNPTFAEHFWPIFTDSGQSLASLNPSVRYIFELQTDLIANVVVHESRSLVLLAARDENGDELDVLSIASEIGVRTTRRFTITEETLKSSNPVHESEDPRALFSTFSTSFDLLAASLRFLDPIKTAGFVLKLNSGVRIGLRSPQFDALTRLHPLSDFGLVQKLLFELVRHPYPLNWLSVPRFKYWIPKFTELKQQYESACDYFDKAWKHVRKAAKVSRADAAVILEGKPLGASEFFLLIKWEKLDADIRDHFSLIPARRVYDLFKAFNDPHMKLLELPPIDTSTNADT